MFTIQSTVTLDMCGGTLLVGLWRGRLGWDAVYGTELACCCVLINCANDVTLQPCRGSFNCVHVITMHGKLNGCVRTSMWKAVL